MSGIATYLSVKMTQPPPQYILPPASLPLVPVRPSLPSGGGGDGTAIMRSSRATTSGGEGRAGAHGGGGRKGHGHHHHWGGGRHHGRNHAGIRGRGGDVRSPTPMPLRGDANPQDTPCSDSPTTISGDSDGDGDALAGSDHSNSGGSDAENVMSRGNQNQGDARLAVSVRKEAALRLRIMGRPPSVPVLAPAAAADGRGGIDDTTPDGAPPEHGAAGVTIGPRGNPVGSLGYKWWSWEDDAGEGTDGEGGVDADTDADSDACADADAPAEKNDHSISNLSADNKSSTTHFPLEISTDNGGVSALLPSGRILVDTVASPGTQAEGDAAPGTDVARDALAGGTGSADAASDVSLEGEVTREGECGDVAAPRDGVRPAALAPPPPSGERAREDSPEAAGSGAPPRAVEDPRPPPPRSVAGKMDASSRRTAPDHVKRLAASHPKSHQGEETELLSPEPVDLLKTLTASSEVSEDATFNSYTPSELSSMMSHLEIRHLLKQGRQQQQDMMMIQERGEEGARGGGGGEGSPPTMVLFSNQSLYRHGKNHASNHTNDRTTPLNKAIRPFLVVKVPASPPQDFPPIQAAQSLSSLQRMDAMEDHSVLSTLHRVDAMVTPKKADSSVANHVHNGSSNMGETSPLSSAVRERLAPSSLGRDDYFRIPHPRQQPREPQYPHLLSQASSLSSNAVPLSRSRMIPPREQGLEEVEDNDDECTFDELRNATPLRCASAATSPSVASSLEGQAGIKVKAEVGVKQETPITASDNRSLENPRKTPSSLKSGRIHVMATTASDVRQTATDLPGEGLLARTHEEGLPTGEGNQGMQGWRKHSGNRNAAFGGGDGYSADRSTSYTLVNANAIDEDSISGTSFVSSTELRHALPMMNTESGEENSLFHGYNGYGHTYSQDTLPQPPHDKPVIPTAFPSLLDSSVSSVGFSVSSTALSSVAGNSVLGGFSSSVKRGGHTMEKEEREDSLPPLSTAPQITIPYRSVEPHGTQPREAAIDATFLQLGGARVQEDPLTASISPSMRLVPSSAAVAATNAYDDTLIASDPRIKVVHERHYIVDLERINEESSFNESRTASSPRNASIGSVPQASSRRATGGTLGSNSNNRFIPSSCTKPGTATDFKRLRSATNPEPPCVSGQQSPPTNLPNPPDQPNTQFYNYRHQYYMEQYHYCDEGFSHASIKKFDGDDDSHHDSDSNCSSVTLSQAFQESDGSDSCSSSITDDCHSGSHTSPSQMSTVSSVTLSRALSVDKHEHSGQGFYVATRLGDYVEIPNDLSNEVEGVEDDAKKELALFKTVYNDDKKGGSVEIEMDADVDDSTAETSESDIKSGGADTTSSEGSSDKSTAGEDIDVNSDATAEGSAGDKPNDKRVQLKPASKDVGSEIISSLVPDCGVTGVPSPSTMTKVESGNIRRMGRAPRGGMLLPWHSTRSIQNYHGLRGGGGKKKKRKSSQTSLYSIGSVHSFRG